MTQQYQRNNIIFRIASADAISKFKQKQADSFMQLVRKELNFDTAAKEAVLLEFDRFSQWIFRIERICCSAGEGILSDHLKVAISESFLDEILTIETVMDAHSDVFSKSVIEYSKILHSYSSKIVFSRFKNALDLRIDSAFKVIVDITSAYLQHILLAFHEFNNNLISKLKPPFICVSDFTELTPEIRHNQEYNRIQYFIKYDCSNSYELKNYTNKNLYDRALIYFANNKIEVTSERHELNNFSQLE